MYLALYSAFYMEMSILLIYIYFNTALKLYLKWSYHTNVCSSVKNVIILGIKSHTKTSGLFLKFSNNTSLKILHEYNTKLWSRINNK